MTLRTRKRGLWHTQTCGFAVSDGKLLGNKARIKFPLSHSEQHPGEVSNHLIEKACAFKLNSAGCTGSADRQPSLSQQRVSHNRPSYSNYTQTNLKPQAAILKLDDVNTA